MEVGRWLIILLWLIFWVLQIQGTSSCIEEERSALLQLKASAESAFKFPIHSWAHESEKSCCTWERVTCNSTTNHITHLSLNKISSLENIWNLNMSIFLHFKELRFLNLSINYIHPFLDNQDVQRLSNLKKLEVLDLSYNKLEMSIFSWIITLSSIKRLDLSQNELTGEIPLKLGNLSEIRAMNLSHNKLTGQIPESFSNLAVLESLDLSYNKLSGEIPSSLTDLHFLAVFSVAYNNLSGMIPDKAQFSTFDNTSFEGNPFLCGSQIGRKCNKNE